MNKAWEEREKALEDEYFRKKSQKDLEEIKESGLEKSCLGRCPKCGVLLKPTKMTDIVLDQCPTCEGVWLDRAKMDDLGRKTSETWFDRWFR